ncbi:hypothetical protein POM88_051711 [Heracleum sosnowskyi]|uniref:Uncharacterized protein n=1 Tax=Heracleum sosnowskyi TaxID=360622 RepID=A0AAD8M1I7_9APIA|nr:hypothetical protein POM88_051711 [Heracleum sosnowskyi]
MAITDECLDDVAEPVDVVEEGGDDAYVDEEGGVLDKNTLELNTTTLPKVEHKMYVSPDILVRCEPLIEILYAKVFTNADASLDVYGDIRILDLEGSKNFLFYERGRFDSPQHICSSSTKNNFLQLQSPQKIPTFNEPLLVVDIKNVDTSVVVARGQKPLLETTHHPSTPNDYEKLFTLQFEGDAHASFAWVICIPPSRGAGALSSVSVRMSHTSCLEVATCYLCKGLTELYNH